MHGIPGPKKLREGDIVGLDLGCIVDGFYGDAARTVAVGRASAEAERLMKVTREALFAGIEVCHPGKRVGDIGHAVQTHAESFGYSVVKDFVGHGIGTSLHEEPQVPNYGPAGRRERLVPGMCLAIEPMVNVGRPEVEVLADGWTAVTRDGSLSAHFELSIAVTEFGPWILSDPYPYARAGGGECLRRRPPGGGKRGARGGRHGAGGAAERALPRRAREHVEGRGHGARGGRLEPAAAAAGRPGGGGVGSLRRGTRPHREAAVGARRTVT